MSQENALTFIRKVYQDPSLQAKVRPLANNDMDALLKIAVGAGFDFTVDDFLAAQVSANTPGDDIADDDLDVIAGGQRSGSVYTILCTLGCQTLAACSKQ